MGECFVGGGGVVISWICGGGCYSEGMGNAVVRVEKILWRGENVGVCGEGLVYWSWGCGDEGRKDCMDRRCGMLW